MVCYITRRFDVKPEYEIKPTFSRAPGVWASPWLSRFHRRGRGLLLMKKIAPQIGIITAVVALFCTAGFFGMCANRAQAGQPEHVQRDVVVLSAAAITDEHDGSYHGLTVFVSSSSTNAPTFPQYPEKGVPLAQALSELISQGFRVESITPQSGNYVPLGTPGIYTLVR